MLDYIKIKIKIAIQVIPLGYQVLSFLDILSSILLCLGYLLSQIE